MYRGVFLNLKRNEQRRADLVRHLEEIQAASRYERLEAVDGMEVASRYAARLDPGNLGLWLTHEKLFQEASRVADQHVHLLEDDVLLAENFVGLLDNLLQELDVRIPSWDLLFTDALLHLRPDEFRKLADGITLYRQSGKYTLVELERLPFAAASSVVFNKRSLAKYCRLIEGNWAQGTSIDLYIQDLVHRGELKAFVTLPFMSTVSRHSVASNIGKKLNLSHSVSETLRRSFFQGADLELLAREMRELVAATTISPLATIYLEAAKFVVSDQFGRS
ncbi:MAG TPA: hypothetical protein VGI40_21165 [Pirellulaceae bacterium]|jgi:GR25 family glycosyltransferase involved in LPS biosynthesis